MKLDIFQGFALKTMLFAYESFQFRRMFRGAGSFSIELNDLSEKENLQLDTIIVARDDAWIIENIHSYKNVVGEITLEATGRHINAILERRIVESFTINTADPIEVQLRKLVADHFISPILSARKVENFYLGALKGIEKKAATSYTLEKMTVLEILNKVCGYSGLGYKVNYYPEQQQFVFEVLEGRNLANAVFFSEEYRNVEEVEVYQESEKYKNAGLRNGIWVGDASGFDRREVFLEEDKNLSEYAKIISVDGMVLNTEQFIYLEDWDLGDTVSYLDKTLGFMVENPILEIQETYASEVDLAVTFGERIPTIFGK